MTNMQNVAVLFFRFRIVNETRVYPHAIDAYSRGARGISRGHHTRSPTEHRKYRFKTSPSIRQHSGTTCATVPRCHVLNDFKAKLDMFCSATIASSTWYSRFGRCDRARHLDYATPYEDSRTRIGEDQTLFLAITRMRQTWNMEDDHDCYHQRPTIAWCT